MSFSKVAQNDARSLKKIGCKLSHKVGGGGDQNQKCDKCHTFFLFSTLTGSLRIIFLCLGLSCHGSKAPLMMGKRVIPS